MYEEIHFRSVQSHLRPGDITYDIGAYNGETSLLIAEAVGASATVIIEPAERNWGNIRERWEGAGLRAPLATFPGFMDAADKMGSQVFLGRFPFEADQLPVDENTLDFRWLHYREIDEAVEARPRMTIDTMAEITGPPRGITMDVEGAERRVLSGAYKTLGAHRPLVWVSIHPEFMVERFDDIAQELHWYMEQLGYKGTLLVKDHEEHFFFEPL